MLFHSVIHDVVLYKPGVTFLKTIVHLADSVMHKLKTLSGWTATFEIAHPSPWTSVTVFEKNAQASWFVLCGT